MYSKNIRVFFVVWWIKKYFPPTKINSVAYDWSTHHQQQKRRIRRRRGPDNRTIAFLFMFFMSTDSMAPIETIACHFIFCHKGIHKYIWRKKKHQRIRRETTQNARHIFYCTILFISFRPLNLTTRTPWAESNCLPVEMGNNWYWILFGSYSKWENLISSQRNQSIELLTVAGGRWGTALNYGVPHFRLLSVYICALYMYIGQVL